MRQPGASYSCGKHRHLDFDAGGVEVVPCTDRTRATLRIKEPVRQVGILSRSVSWYMLARGRVPMRTHYVCRSAK